MGTLLGIAYKLEKYGTIITCDSAWVGLKTGVAKDVRGTAGNRQVTVLSKSGFDAACAKVGKELDWTTRRANLLVDGIELIEKTGNYLIIGNLVLEITGETTPCYRMDEQCDGLKEALKPDWRGGVTCRVIREGNIKLGDSVSMTDSATENPV
jgi:MOSC domain-containing protein YiiM